MSSVDGLPPNRRSPVEVQLPDSLLRQLAGFRRYLWSTKLTEAVCAAGAIGLAAYLTTYALDRWLDTPAGLRWLSFMLAVVAWIGVPYALHRWVWRQRTPSQLARTLRHRQPGVGDELLSAIELAENDAEQARSPALCRAAIGQVAQRVEGRDLRLAAPRHRLAPLAMLLSLFAAAAAGLFVLYPAAARNAWLRFASPWKQTTRYTFTQLGPLPARLVIPHGEPVPLRAELDQRSVAQPAEATLRLGALPPLPAVQRQQAYEFQLPPLTAPTPARLSAGDYYQTIALEPMLRPELASLIATVRLPAYLQRKDPLEIDARSGVLAAVTGSQASLQATASRPLASAWLDDSALQPNGRTFVTPEVALASDETTAVLRWQDQHGLTGHSPFQLQLKPLDDESPSVAVQGMPGQAVVLHSQQLNFTVLAADDFGIKRVGLAWRGLDQTLVAKPAVGEKVIAAGGPDQTALQLSANFSAAALGIAAQPLEVTVWVEDYRPDGLPVHSPPYLLYVLTPDEHAIWITSQMSKWHRAALDVRDVELQLHEANRRLRDRAATELLEGELLEQLARQAMLEEANGRRLGALTQAGAELLRQAARNPDVAVDNLQHWAEMLDVLGDIAGQRMPGVADLLRQAAQPTEPAVTATAQADGPRDRAPQAGQMRAAAVSATDPAAAAPVDESSPPVPSIVDGESSLQAPDALSGQPGTDEQSPESSAARLTLPQTTLIGPAVAADQSEDDAAKPPPRPPVEQALEKQLELLAEFDKVADQLNAVLANLEGSTLVKRLKAASREQNRIAERIASRLESVFGRAKELAPEDRELLASLTQTQHQGSQTLSFIMDDMQAFYDRRKTREFQAVLEEMKSSDVLAALQKLGEELPVEHGLSIAQAEYWADTIDRWAEDLVESGDDQASDQESESGSRESLPPAIILEMLQVLEGEVNLREQTREAHQAQAAMAEEDYLAETERQATWQGELRQRVNEVVQQIARLPEAAENFGQEMELLAAVGQVMEEAKLMLGLGNTGPPTIAAQTEVIELLLQSRRINPQGSGGGGGSTPGGGGFGATDESALALIGAGLNLNERRERRDVDQATGRAASRVLPEEFRGGLDAYFQRLEAQ